MEKKKAVSGVGVTSWAQCCLETLGPGSVAD